MRSTPGSVLATKVAVLRQDNHLAARLTVQDLVSFGRYPYSKGRLTSVDRDAIEDVVRRHVVSGRGNHAHLDAFVAQGDREVPEERPGRVAGHSGI